MSLRNDDARLLRRMAPLLKREGQSDEECVQYFLRVWDTKHEDTEWASDEVRDQQRAAFEADVAAEVARIKPARPAHADARLQASRIAQQADIGPVIDDRPGRRVRLGRSKDR